MENVGESKPRNLEFQEKFSRENLFRNLVKAHEPVIFDIGAHHGESVAYLKGVFPKAAIYSFEPDPDSFAVLSASLIEGVNYFNLALSDADGTASFFCNQISHTNSLLKVNLNSKDSISIAKAKAKAEKDDGFFESFNKENQVRTVRLDAFVQQYSIDYIDLLKIDVQGAECWVLKGGEATLTKVGVIVLEISFFDYYEHQTSFGDVEELLSPHGFRLFSISELSNNPMNGRTDWAEVIYVNTNSARVESKR